MVVLNYFKAMQEHISGHFLVRHKKIIISYTDIIVITIKPSPVVYSSNAENRWKKINIFTSAQHRFISFLTAVAIVIFNFVILERQHCNFNHKVLGEIPKSKSCEARWTVPLELDPTPKGDQN